MACHRNRLVLPYQAWNQAPLLGPGVGDTSCLRESRPEEQWLEILHLNRSEWLRHCQARMVMSVSSSILLRETRGREVRFHLSIYSHQPVPDVKYWRGICLFSVVIPYLRGWKVPSIHGYGCARGKCGYLFFFLKNRLKVIRPYPQPYPVSWKG